MRHHRALYLSRPDSVTRDVQDVIDAADDGEITLFVPARAVPREIHAGDVGEILLLEPLVVTVDRSHDARPGSAHHEHPARAGADALAVLGDHVRLDTEERQARGAGL